MAVDATSAAKSTMASILENGSNKAAERKVGEMGKDQFLNLLVAQLKNQDPMNPTDDKEFIGQMAQFSSLEQMQNLNTSFASVKGINFLGRTVKASIVDADTKATKDVSGVVTDVKMTDKGVVAMVNGTEVPVEKVTDISELGLGSGVQDVSRYTGYIGFKVNGTYTDADKNNLSVTGIVKEITKGTLEEQAVVDGASFSIANVDSPTRLSTLDDKKAYLDNQVGKDITVTTADDSGKYAMKISGKLNSYSVDTLGRIQVKMDDVKIPVKSVSSVMDSRY